MLPRHTQWMKVKRAPPLQYFFPPDIGGRICGSEVAMARVHLGLGGQVHLGPSTGHYPAPRQCHRQSLPFTAPLADFPSLSKWYHFNGMFCSKRTLLTFWAFWRSQPLKNPKRSFYEQNISLKWYHFKRLGKYVSCAVNGSDCRWHCQGEGHYPKKAQKVVKKCQKIKPGINLCKSPAY